MQIAKGDMPLPIKAEMIHGVFDLQRHRIGCANESKGAEALIRSHFHRMWAVAVRTRLQRLNTGVYRPAMMARIGFHKSTLGI